MLRSAQRGLAVLCLLLAPAGPARADQADEPVDYNRQVKPLLRQKCYACHGALEQEGNLRLDTADLIRRGGFSGAAVQPGRAAVSLLVERITAEDESLRMPQDGAPLDEHQIAVIKRWIDAGAPGSADEQPERDPREHWSFRPPLRPTLPGVRNPAWTANPIDVFIAARHDQHGLTGSPPAAKEVLLRRLHLDLVGLPPARDDLHEFLADRSEDAHGKVVDRLLASVHYGERWGRHWMDVWRYSDWYGRRHVPDVWNSAPQVWRWRDWIVRSLNAGKGYDRMLHEMLAADEIAPGDGEALVATGYLARNWYALNPNQWMRDTVEHTGKAFLGLTFNCAHCHDHKYDPIRHEDYFRLRAFFEPLALRQDRWPGEPDAGPFQKYEYSVLRKVVMIGSVGVFDERLDAETFMYAAGDERRPIAGRGPVAPGVPAALTTPAAPDTPAAPGGSLDIRPVDLPPEAWYPGTKPFIRQAETAARERAVNQTTAELAEVRRLHDEQHALAAAELAAAEEKVAAAVTEAAASEPALAALAGRQSLLLEASQGRCVLANSLDDLKSIESAAVVSFLVRILKDGHTNLQLGLNINTGATGGYVAFDNGRIQTYRPGTFETFDAGRYDFPGGPTQFDVRMELDPPANLFRLTVTAVPGGEKLVDAVPAALNGWNPAAGSEQGLFIDARPGTVALYDAIVFAPAPAPGPGPAPGGSPPVLAFDFEPPHCVEGRDVVGAQGWIAPPENASPARSSVVSVAVVSPALEAARAELQTAQRRLDAVRLSVEAAEAKLTAARSDLHGLTARIAADDARYADPGGDAAELISAAVRAERESARTAAQAQVAQADHALAAAEGQPIGAEKRDAAIAAARKQVATVRDALSKAEQALSGSGEDYTPLSPRYPRQSTGRRRALAEWITSRENPLAARVAVNHVWGRHFGQPLVATVADFGRNGAEPTHPELLDWLAVELMEHGWEMKQLHRLIVTSSVYRQSSQPASRVPHEPPPQDGAAAAADRENQFLSRFSPWRMQAEVVRDSVLHAAGQLDATFGGPPLDNAADASSRRRALYFSIFPEAGGNHEFLRMFDAPDPCDCYRRTETVVPQQALALTNSQLVLNQSRLLARSLSEGLQKQPDEFIVAAFEQVLTRRPTVEELSACREFLARQAALLAEQMPTGAGTTAEGLIAPAPDPALRARESLVRALFSHGDFVMVR